MALRVVQFGVVVVLFTIGVLLGHAAAAGKFLRFFFLLCYQNGGTWNGVNCLPVCALERMCALIRPVSGLLGRPRRGVIVLFLARTHPGRPVRSFLAFVVPSPCPRSAVPSSLLSLNRYKRTANSRDFTLCVSIGKSRS